MRLIDADAYQYPGDLINEPTIDAVEVVRCRNCIYRDIPKCCPYQFSGFRITHDWFCPMGVKMDAEVE